MLSAARGDIFGPSGVRGAGSGAEPRVPEAGIRAFTRCPPDPGPHQAPGSAPSTANTDPSGAVPTTVRPAVTGAGRSEA